MANASPTAFAVVCVCVLAAAAALAGLAPLWLSVATVFAFLLWAWGQARMSATHAAVILSTEPVFAVIFAGILPAPLPRAPEEEGDGEPLVIMPTLLPVSGSRTA